MSSSSVGSMITSPVIPSTITISPCFTSWVIDLVPTTAAISNERLIIAEWLVRPPIFVTKPWTNSLFNCAVSDGVKSFPIITTLSSIILGFGNSTPKRWASTRLETSRISAARSLIYSLSIDSKIVMNWVVTSFNASGALTFSFAILSSIGWINSGSSSTSKCASKIAALSAPNDFSALFLIFVNSILEASKAFLNFLISASVSVIFSFVNDKSGSTSKYALAIATPSEAAIPLINLDIITLLNLLLIKLHW